MHTSASPNYQSSLSDPPESGRLVPGPYRNVDGPSAEHVAAAVADVEVYVVDVADDAVVVACVVHRLQIHQASPIPHPLPLPCPSCRLPELPQVLPTPCSHQ